MADGSIKIDTKIDDKSLNKTLSNFNTKMKKGLKKTAKAAAIALAAVGAAMAAVAKGAKEFSIITDRIDKLSQKLGLSAEAFQKWDFILSQTGSSVEAVSMGLKNLSTLMVSSTNAADDTDNAFNQLGVTITDGAGNLRNQESVFQETVEALQMMEDGAEKAALANKIFGRSGQELMPLLNAQAGTIDALSKRAEELGLVLSQDLINKGVILTDAMDQMKRVGRGLFAEMFAPAVPLLNQVLEAILNWVVAMGGLQGIAYVVRDAFITSWRAVVGAFEYSVAAIKIAIISTQDFLYRAALAIDRAYYELGNSIVLAFVVAWNAVKIGAISVAKVITDIVIKGVGGMLDIMSKLPIVGEDFALAAEAVKNFGSAADDGMTKAKNAAAENIKAIKEEIAEGREQYRQSAQESKDNASSQIADVKRVLEEKRTAQMEQGVLNDEARAERDAARVLDAEQAAEEARERLRTKELFEQINAAQNRYYAKLKENQAKVKAGYMSENDALKENLSAMEEFVDMLFSMGISIDSTAEEGGDILRGLLDQISGTREQIEANDAGGEIGESVMDGLGEKIWEGIKKVYGIIKNVITGIIRVAQKIFAGISKVINWAKAFDPKELYTSFKETIEGLRDFLMTDIQSIPIFAQMALDLLNGFIETISNNLPSISASITNMLNTIAQMVIDNAPYIISSFFNIVSQILLAIVDAAPQVFEAVVVLLNSFNQSIIDNAPMIIGAIGDLLIMAIGAFVDAFPAIQAASHAIIMAFATFLMENIDTIIVAISDLFEMVFDFMGDNAPEVTDMVLSIIIAIVESLLANSGRTFDAFIMMFNQVLFALIQWFSDPKNFAKTAKALIDGLIEGISNAAVGLKDIIGGIGHSIVTWFNDIFKIKSPSRVFKEMGGQLMAGMEAGIEGDASKVASAASNVKDLAVKAMTGKANISLDSNVSAIDALERRLSGGINANVNSAVSLGSSIISLNVNAPLTVDGAEIGRIAYEHLDEVAM